MIFVDRDTFEKGTAGCRQVVLFQVSPQVFLREVKIIQYWDLNTNDLIGHHHTSRDILTGEIHEEGFWLAKDRV